ncbi:MULTISPECIES: hypothetical protein [unclassified Rhodococcus (in: high G+C Gram-positive bacteria)]|uniref:hypothetical protein n=1 Tax=unclassified Rhodococcus (in: high G+C Gram-positive bacteria) TaxID=192944 RepID=UPI0015C6971D|nr:MULTISPECIES: hypothetical protein [unclassified Rhodococcus (in: high G+C Gram-positive bacteria)]
MFLELLGTLLGGGAEGGIGGIIADGISAGIADAISELFTGSAEGLSSVAE